MILIRFGNNITLLSKRKLAHNTNNKQENDAYNLTNCKDSRKSQEQLI